MENLLKFEEIDILAEKLADFVDKNDVVAWWEISEQARPPL